MPPAFRRTLRQVRRPLLALAVLVVALAIGYGVRACDSNDTGSHTSRHTHGAAYPETVNAGQRAGTERR